MAALPGPIDKEKQDSQALVPLREMKGQKERLTEAQARVLSALFAGYTVCTSHSSSVPHHDQVLIGNGSRLSLVTVESLLIRSLIEEAQRLLEPQLPLGYPEHWRKRLILFQLTEQGRQEVIRQGLRFIPEEVVCSLPWTVGLLLAEMARYQIRYACSPEVAIRGVVPSEKGGWQVRLPTWRRVVAYNETNNLLGLVEGTCGEDEAALLWVRPEGRGWRLTSSVRVRLRPLPHDEMGATEEKARNWSVNDE